MSMISEQVKRLRKIAMDAKTYPYISAQCTEAADTIEMLSAKVRQGWVACSERLPEDEQEILFSTKTGRAHSGIYHDDDSANPWYSHRDKVRAWSNVVTAWMPLPEPYEGGEKE